MLARESTTPASHRRIHVEPQLCRDCQACTLGCSLLHEGECSPGLARLRVAKDMARYTFEITVCHHCDAPACLDACPTGAIRLDDRGVALIVEAECERCGACLAACPHDAIFHLPGRRGGEDRYVKCDLCSGRAGGPACVELCPVGALTLGR